jgi:hypothetical protein
MSTIYKTSFIVSILVMLGFSSCIVNHIGNAGQNIPPLGTNYKILSVAQGKASSTRFLGIQTTNRDALTAEAMQNMILKYPLSKGQTYSFLNVDSRNSSFFLFNETTITVSSFLIEAADSMTNDRDLILLLNNQKNLGDSRKFPIGSRVYFIENNKIVEGLVRQYISFDEALIVYVAASGKAQIKKSFNDLFPTANSFKETLKSNFSMIEVLKDSILKVEESNFLESKKKEQDYGSFKIGDKVYFQTIKGKTLGEITKIEGDNISIDYEEKKGVNKTAVINRLKVILATE